MIEQHPINDVATNQGNGNTLLWTFAITVGAYLFGRCIEYIFVSLLPSRHMRIIFVCEVDQITAKDHSVQASALVTNKSEFDRSFEIRTKKIVDGTIKDF